MPLRVRVPFLVDILFVDDPTEARILNDLPSVGRERVGSGPILNRATQARLHRELRVDDRALPVFVGRSDPQRALRQRQLEAEFARRMEEGLAGQRGEIRRLADWVAWRCDEVAPGVVVQQLVGRLFDPGYRADEASYEAAETVNRWIGGGTLGRLWLQISGRFRRAKELLWNKAGNDSHAIHGTSIAMHNIVEALVKMRRLATEKPLPDADEAVRRCLVAPQRVLRACHGETRAPFLRRPLKRGSLIIFRLQGMQENYGNGAAFMDGEWSECPAHLIVPAILKQVWNEGPARHGAAAEIGKRDDMRNEVTVETGDGPISDVLRTSPVDDDQLRTRRKLVAGVLIAFGLLAAWALWRFLGDRPVEYDDITAHYRYGSIGSEVGGSLFNVTGGALPPYWVFRALPTVCSDMLPGGYASTGMIFETDDSGEPRDLPIGVSRRHRLGTSQVGFNCAACHTGTIRDSPDSERRIVLGMPSHQLDLQKVVQFVLDCSLDRRLTADAVVAAIEEQGDSVGFVDRLLMPLVIEQVRDIVVAQRQAVGRAVGDEVPRWGPGRVDTFNTYKSIQFGWRLEELPLEELIGAADFPSIWNQQPREGMQLHWDGNNDSVDERNLSASLGAGVTPVTIDHERLQRVRDWIWTLEPPRYPYPIDETLATQGEALYRTECYSCHGDHRFRDGVVPTGTTVGTVVALDEIGTDRYRFTSYTPMFAATQSLLYPESQYRFTRFRKTDGYANHPLDGIWARAPYLHNGSVPSLRALLDAPADRPATFYRGYDVYDRVNVGFVSDVAAEGGRDYFLFDTSIPGNSNAGHVYGTDLSEQQKRAIVEYLKRF